ncbi:MAG: hypothetical protein GY711_01915 [bacterium]|nr:hypothetical protein [bacterium]
MSVLALDLRGHGTSAPELAPRVQARDSVLFNAMHADVAGAFESLTSVGADTTRVALAGASVGCSVAIDSAGRMPDAFRSVCVMTPGASYLGVDTIEDIGDWPGLPTLVLTSNEEREKVEPVADALKEKAPETTQYRVVDGTRIHGTRMFGKVDGIEDAIVSFFRETLVTPDLTVPHFAADDERENTTGSVRPTRHIWRTLPAKGDAPAPRFDVAFELAGVKLLYAWDTEAKTATSKAHKGLEGEAPAGRAGSRSRSYRTSPTGVRVRRSCPPAARRSAFD